MNDLQIFNNPDFGEIRTVIIDGEPWFVGKDLTAVLGYKNNSSAMRNVPQQFKRLCSFGTPSGKQDMTVINESGLYKLIFGSKLESAEKFTMWVSSEVLPSIRKTGGYSAAALPQSTDGKIALLAQGHVELREEIGNVKNEVETVKATVSDIRQGVEDFKLDMPLFPTDLKRLRLCMNRRIVGLLGGKDSNAYRDRSITQTAYHDAYTNNLNSNFRVRSYMDIKRRDLDYAIDIIENYTLPYYLQKKWTMQITGCLKERMIRLWQVLING